MRVVVQLTEVELLHLREIVQRRAVEASALLNYATHNGSKSFGYWAQEFVRADNLTKLLGRYGVVREGELDAPA